MNLTRRKSQICHGWVLLSNVISMVLVAVRVHDSSEHAHKQKPAYADDIRQQHPAVASLIFPSR
jgi:hypothetical protein